MVRHLTLSNYSVIPIIHDFLKSQNKNDNLSFIETNRFLLNDAFLEIDLFLKKA